MMAYAYVQVLVWFCNLEIVNSYVEAAEELSKQLYLHLKRFTKVNLNFQRSETVTVYCSTIKVLFTL